MIQLLSGDARDVLPTLAADSVQCVVTSPPYFALRDYGTATWDGGDAACDHVAGNARNDVTPERLAERAAQYGTGTGAGSKVGAMQFRDTCGKCGATRIDRQIGLEATPDEYLATMVAVFREVKRVLRPDGTCWVNMGDSYWNGGGEKRDGGHGFVDGGKTKLDAAKGALLQARCSAPGYKPKDLLMMPARLALALQADGWWLRSDIIWHKPNPMPESVTDRPTSAHEHVFLLTKRSRYFFDATAIAEPVSETHGAQAWRRIFDPSKQGKEAALKDAGIKGGNDGERDPNATHRACRNVWTIATAPYSDAHFATFPPALAERCIRAGTSERGACSQCGAPWIRTTERSTSFEGGSGRAGRTADEVNASGKWAGIQYGTNIKLGPVVSSTTTGWAASCRCGTTETRPCVVLDPFAGAGTTLLVADRLQRDAIGIELSPDYTRMAMQRCQDDAPLFTSFPPAETDAQDERMRDLFRDAAD